jgi:hypothetical protein
LQRHHCERQYKNELFAPSGHDGAEV